MKAIFTILLFTSFAAHASPLMTVKERLRLDMWINGVDERPVINKKAQAPQRPLPEELERALQKT
ncbi:hypothetical protein ACJVC5_02840 [Peredibacter sp. HCB2-198]|uniref:hypothetical protein n=1 Tax=Peredibacter sp. HCB2-198 TaxID=3383025 RepID=UPI0038B4E16B